MQIIKIAYGPDTDQSSHILEKQPQLLIPGTSPKNAAIHNPKVDVNVNVSEMTIINFLLPNKSSTKTAVNPDSIGKTKMLKKLPDIK